MEGNKHQTQNVNLSKNAKKRRRKKAKINKDVDKKPESPEDSLSDSVFEKVVLDKALKDNEVTSKPPSESAQKSVGKSLKKSRDSLKWASITKDIMKKWDSDIADDRKSVSSDGSTLSRKGSRTSLLEDIAQGNSENWDPEACVTLLRMPSVTNYSGIKKLIGRAKREWIEDFLVLDGLGMLFESLERISQVKSSSIADALLQLECVMCIKAVMNNATGLKHITNDRTYVRKLAQALHTTNILVKKQVFELLSALCMYSSKGHCLALDALNNYKVFYILRYRFQLVIQELTNAEVLQYKVSLLGFINCLILGEPNLETRSSLRNEFIGLDLLNVLDNLRDSESESVILQIDAFEESLQEDHLSLFGEQDNVVNHYDIFNTLFNRVKDSPKSLQLLTLLQSLSELDESRDESDDAWNSIEKIALKILNGNHKLEWEDIILESTHKVSVGTQTVRKNVKTTNLHVESAVNDISDSSKTNNLELKTCNISATNQLTSTKIPRPPPFPGTTKSSISPVPTEIDCHSPKGISPHPPPPTDTESGCASPMSSLLDNVIPIPPPPPSNEQISGIPIPPPPPTSVNNTGIPIPPPQPLPMGEQNSTIPIPPPPPSMGTQDGIPLPPPPPSMGTQDGIPLPPPPPPGMNVRGTSSSPSAPPPPLPGVMVVPKNYAANNGSMNPSSVHQAFAFMSTPFINQIFSNHIPKPKSKMRHMNWGKVTGQGLQQSVWREIFENPEKMIPNNFNYSEIERLFCQKVIEKKSNKKEKPKNEKITLLDPKNSLNISIFLKQYKVSPDIVASYIKNCETNKIGSDKLRSLAKVIPDQQEIECIKEHSEDFAKLDLPDQFLYHLCRIPFYKHIVDGMILKVELDDSLAALQPQLDSLLKVCNFMLHNDGIKSFFAHVLTLGNFLNMGSYAGNAGGFKLNTISKLWETRANEAGITLLHYIVEESTENKSDLLNFSSDIATDISTTKRLSVEHIKGEVQRLNSELKKLSTMTNKYPEDFRLFQEFVENSDEQIKELVNKLNGLETERIKLAKYFCEDESKFRLEDCIDIFYILGQKIDQAKRDNISRKEREVKRKRKEEERKHFEIEKQKAEASGVKLRPRNSYLQIQDNKEECVVDALLNEIRKGNFKLRKKSE